MSLESKLTSTVPTLVYTLMLHIAVMVSAMKVTYSFLNFASM